MSSFQRSFFLDSCNSCLRITLEKYIVIKINAICFDNCFNYKLNNNGESVLSLDE